MLKRAGRMRTLTEYITNLKRKASDGKLEHTNFLCNPVEISCPSLFALSSISNFSCWIPWRFATRGAVRCDASRRPLLPDACAAQTNSHTRRAPWREDMHTYSEKRDARESYSTPSCPAIQNVATDASLRCLLYIRWANSQNNSKGVLYIVCMCVWMN